MTGPQITMSAPIGFTTTITTPTSSTFYNADGNGILNNVLPGDVLALKRFGCDVIGYNSRPDLGAPFFRGGLL